MPKTTTLPPRAEVPVEQTWNVQSIFPSDEAWEQAYKKVEAQIPSLEKFQGQLGKNPKTLLEWFEASENAFRLMGKVAVYASSNQSVDTGDQVAAGRYGQVRSLWSKVEAATAFAEPELMAVGFKKLRKWMDDEPRLAVYKHYFDELEDRQAHVRSGEVEETLALASDPLNTVFSIYGVLANADLKFKSARGKRGKKREVGQSSIGSLITDPDRKVRRTAWNNYADVYLGVKNTMANCLTAAVKKDVFYARARRYGSSLEASLGPNKIPVEVFYNLIDVFKKNLPTWHRYWDVRRRALGYKRLHVYDIKAPLATNPPKVPFQQAVDWICEGLKPLGEEYVSVLRQGATEERWVDYCLNRGKRAGAFSSGTPGTHPMIMMSYTNDLYSLSTLAHELGHSLHSYFSWETQPFVYAHYALFVAEVASNFNQAMVRDYLFKTQTDRDFQIALIEEAMSNYHRYFFIMPTLARFELEMHERVERGEPTSAQTLIDLTADLFQEGYGNEVVIDHDRIGITWAQFGHMYMNFYVYQYATGISGAHALSDSILSRKRGAAKKYLAFLKAGGSMYPMEALKLAGVDLSSQEPVEKAFAVLADLVDRLDQLLS